MACLFAARLTAAGIPVTMLGTWPAGLQALREHGVTLVTGDGQETTFPVRATDDPSQCTGTTYALVLVKSWQTWRAAKQLDACLVSDGVALTLQNGVGNREALSQVLGAARVALGVTTAGAYLLGPGRTYLAGDGVTSLGIHSRLGPLASKLRAAGFVVENAPDPDVLLWGKLVINAAINPVTALLGIHNGELMVRPTARAVMVALAREAAAVAIAQGIRLPYPDPVVASMLQDVQRGAPTEIDAICGAVMRAGEQTGIPTPVNRTMWQLIKALGPRSETQSALKHTE